MTVGLQVPHPLATPDGRSPLGCPVTTYLEGLAPTGRRILALALHQFAAVITDGEVTRGTELDWSKISYAHTARARAVWNQRYTPAGAKVRLAAVKSCLKVAWRMGLLSAEQYQRAVDIPPIRGKSLPRGRSLSEADIRALFVACAAEPHWLHGVRDAAIFALFCSGIRVGELVALDLADWLPSVPPEPDALRVRHGKGNKGRWAYLDPSFGAHVRAWLELRGDQPGPLVCSVHAGGIRGTRLAAGSVMYCCRRRAMQAGLERFSPHDWRRTTATTLKLAGVSLPDIQAVLGHESIATTRGYFRDDEEAAKRRAVTFMAALRPGDHGEEG